MKVTVDIDCSPEEARRFLGLPDLTPVHQVYLDKMQKAIAEGSSGELVADMVKSWGPMSEAGMTVWTQMIEQMSGKR